VARSQKHRMDLRGLLVGLVRAYMLRRRGLSDIRQAQTRVVVELLTDARLTAFDEPRGRHRLSIRPFDRRRSFARRMM